MKTRVQSNFLKQQTMHINPIQECRTRTDVAFIIIFGVIFWFWISITIQALVYPTVLEFTDDTGCGSDCAIIDEKAYVLFDVKDIELSFTWLFPLCTLVAGIVAIVYMFLLFQPKIGYAIIYIAAMILFASIFANFTGVIILLRGHSYAVIGSVSLFLLMYLVYQTVVLYCFGNIGVKPLFEIIGDSCWALLFYPSCLLFVSFMSILIILIFSLSLYVLKKIPTYYMRNSHIVTYCAIEIFGASAIIAFITNFTQLVISGFAFDSFWAKDKNLALGYLITKNIKRTLSFHMGTVSFGSIPLLPNICAIVQACCCESDTDGIPKKDNIFIRFVSQISLIINMRDFALIQTSIYGSNYTTSIVTAIDLASQNSKLNLAATEISNIIVMIGVVLTILPFEVEKLYFAMYSIPVPFFIILITAFRALLVNKMIMQNTSKAIKRLIVVQVPSTPPMYYV